MQTNNLIDFYQDYVDERIDFYTNTKLRRMKIFLEKLKNLNYEKIIKKLKDKNSLIERYKKEVVEKKVKLISY